MTCPCCNGTGSVPDPRDYVAPVCPPAYQGPLLSLEPPRYLEELRRSLGYARQDDDGSLWR